jgi:hypothetical protein
VVSRRLPQRCNLEHLRKEAKAVLRACGAHTPGWRLSDAQHAIARGYGFANWSKLKAFVESLPPVSASRAEQAPGVHQTPEPRRIRPRHEANGSAAVVRAAHPIAGTWISNRAQSSSAEGPGNLHFMLSVGVAGETITLTQVTLGAPGHEVAMKMTIRADGQDHPVQSGSPDVLQAWWTNSRVLEATLKRGDDTVVRGRYELSADGTTLTVSTAGHVLVFRRA